MFAPFFVLLFSYFLFSMCPLLHILLECSEPQNCSESERDILEPNIGRHSISCTCKSDFARNALSAPLTIFGIYCNWERPVCIFELSESSVSRQSCPLNAASDITMASTSERQQRTQNVEFAHLRPQCWTRRSGKNRLLSFHTTRTA
jgi:hypothetical protein